MKLGIGIDAGGTYTDAVLLDLVSGRVQHQAKALTTPRDLSIGIAQAMAGLGAASFQRVKLVSISTTLATNAIVEGRGSPVCLLLVGYDPGLIEQYGLERELVTDDVV